MCEEYIKGTCLYGESGISPFGDKCEHKHTPIIKFFGMDFRSIEKFKDFVKYLYTLDEDPYKTFTGKDKNGKSKPLEEKVQDLLVILGHTTGNNVNVLEEMKNGSSLLEIKANVKAKSNMSLMSFYYCC